VSADKDGYVPPQSARVQVCDASIRDAQREVPHGQVRWGEARAGRVMVALLLCL